MFARLKFSHLEPELLSIDNNEQLLIQKLVKGNEKDQDVENEKIKDKPVVEEPAQKEMGRNVMTMAMLTGKQHLLQQQHTGCITKEPDSGEIPLIRNNGN
eukprot:6871322-Ditylum_brightwellii.AAC.1